MRPARQKATHTMANVDEPLEDFSRTTAFEGLARAGYAARGLIYILMGILALRLSNGLQGSEKSPNQQGAIHELLQQPFGRFLVIALAVGLAGYAIWRFTQAIVGRTPEQGRYDAKDRVAAVASGVTYSLFCWLAIGAFLGRDRKTPPRRITADLLSWPGGPFLVGLAGAAFVGVGAYQAKLALSGDFEQYSKTHEMPRSIERPFFWLGRIGHAARAVIFALVGVFLVRTAFLRDAGETVGIDDALMRVLHHTWGGITVGLIGIGMVLFGVYSVMDARYRKV